MSDEVEIETHDLQETIEEIHHERAEREEEERKGKWTRYIALTTAILAAFAAIASLESGGLANEGMLNQLKASDTWNEYQSDRQKIHIYSLQAANLLDAQTNPAPATAGEPPKTPVLKAESASTRLRDYLSEIDVENTKSDKLNKDAKKLGDEAKDQIEKHHRFAYSVALLQVAIALGAVSALTRSKPVWVLSSALGLAGIGLFFWGFGLLG